MIQQPSGIINPNTSVQEIESHISRSLEAISGDSAGVFELSILTAREPTPYLRKGYFDDWSILAELVASETQKPTTLAVWVNLQELKQECSDRVDNQLVRGITAVDSHDIARYRRFVLDIDRSGETKVSATDAEKVVLCKSADDIVSFMCDVLHWPKPVYHADSSNGYHLAWSIDLRATADNQNLIKLSYSVLQKRFGSDTVKIDTSLHDPNQLIKVYGTYTRKGEDTPERPHRLSQLLEVNETVSVSRAQLDALVRLGKQPPAKPGTGRAFWRARIPSAVETWAQKYEISLGECQPSSHMYTGEGYKWHVDCLTSDVHTDGAALFLNGNGYLKYKCHHDSCSEMTIADVLEHYPAEDQRDGQPYTSEDYLSVMEDGGYVFTQNDLDDTIEVNGKPIDEGLAAEIRTYMRDLGFHKIAAIEDSYTACAYRNRYHPVRRFLDGLEWDGQDHFASLCQHLHDAHAPIIYHDKTGNTTRRERIIKVWLWKWMLAAVAKAYERNVQGPVLVLDGEQGIGKSQLVVWLASVLSSTFLEAPVHPDNKEHDRYLATKWIWEIAELGATTRRADREALKAFISKGDVTFRVPWVKHPVRKPALANFIGTINNEMGFLTDPTGNRRFLVVTLESIDWSYANLDPSQVWAQIAAAYKSGQSWELLPEEQAVRDGSNKQYERLDPTEDMLVGYFDIDIENTEWFLYTADIAKVLRTKAWAKDSDQVLFNGIGTAARRLGLKQGQKSIGGQRGRGYFGIRVKLR